MFRDGTHESGHLLDQFALLAAVRAFDCLGLSANQPHLLFGQIAFVFVGCFPVVLQQAG